MHHADAVVWGPVYRTHQIPTAHDDRAPRRAAVPKPYRRAVQAKHEHEREQREDQGVRALERSEVPVQRVDVPRERAPDD